MAKQPWFKEYQQQVLRNATSMAESLMGKGLSWCQEGRRTTWCWSTSRKAAGLVETLAGEGPFTVFAPTNKAFAKIPKQTLDGLLADKDALTAVLLRHVVPGAALKAGDVPEGETNVKTAGGEEITVSRTRYLKIKSAAAKTGVAAFDILATNGVVHLINDVI